MQLMDQTHGASVLLNVLVKSLSSSENVHGEVPTNSSSTVSLKDTRHRKGSLSRSRSSIFHPVGRLGPVHDKLPCTAGWATT